MTTGNTIPEARLSNHSQAPKAYSQHLIESQARSVGRHALGFLGKLPAKLLLQGRKLSLDILSGLPLLDHFLPIPAQEVVDRFHTNPDRTGWLVFVEVLETEVRGARLFDDAFDHPVDGRIM